MKRTPSLGLGAPAGEQGQEGASTGQDRVLTKIAGAQENLAILASLHPRSKTVLGDLNILKDESHAPASRTESDGTAEVAAGNRTRRVARAMSLGQDSKDQPEPVRRKSFPTPPLASLALTARNLQQPPSGGCAKRLESDGEG